jgi:hypothetical protein
MTEANGLSWSPYALGIGREARDPPTVLGQQLHNTRVAVFNANRHGSTRSGICAIFKEHLDNRLVTVPGGSNETSSTFGIRTVLNQHLHNGSMSMPGGKGERPSALSISSHTMFQKQLHNSRMTILGGLKQCRGTWPIWRAKVDTITYKEYHNALVASASGLAHGPAGRTMFGVHVNTTLNQQLKSTNVTIFRGHKGSSVSRPFS